MGTADGVNVRLRSRSQTSKSRPERYSCTVMFASTSRDIVPRNRLPSDLPREVDRPRQPASDGRKSRPSPINRNIVVASRTDTELLRRAVAHRRIRFLTQDLGTPLLRPRSHCQVRDRNGRSALPHSRPPPTNPTPTRSEFSDNAHSSKSGRIL